MKPETSLPQINPENFGVQPKPTVENVPILNNPERSQMTGAEQAGRRAENTVVDSGIVTPVILPMPAPVAQPVVDSTTPTSNYPLLASDDDLIEKDWVDKAKKILAETKDNPFLREKEVNKLQVDYIKKRYGRELGTAE